MVELMAPHLDVAGCCPAKAKQTGGDAGFGLCLWTETMSSFFWINKEVLALRAKLAVTQVKLEAAATELDAAACASSNLSTPTPEQVATFAAAVVDPVLSGIVAEIAAMTAAIEADPDIYRAEVKGLIVDDKSTYDNQFHKSTRGARKVDFDGMIRACTDGMAAIAGSLPDPTTLRQPESNVAMLILATMRQKDGFEAAIRGPLEATGAALTFRPSAKALFRCIEKALL